MSSANVQIAPEENGDEPTEVYANGRMVQVSPIDPAQTSNEPVAPLNGPSTAPYPDDPPSYSEIDKDKPQTVIPMPEKTKVPSINGTPTKRSRSPKNRVGVAEDKDSAEEEEEAKPDIPPVGIFALFKFASCIDFLLMLIGSIAAISHGSALPLSLLFFGEVIDSFIDTSGINGTELNTSSLPFDPYNAPSNVCLAEYASLLPASLNPFTQINDLVINFVILGSVVFVVAFLQSACWNLAAERQVHRIRILYFRKILGKDIEWFDKNKGGELTTRISDDIDKIREGTGAKVAIFLQAISTCIAGLTIGFIRSWHLTLVILGVSIFLIMPIMSASGVLVKRYSQQALDSYAEAGNIADEVFTAIRTVVAFGGEAQELKRYTAKLYKAKNSGIKKAATEALSGGGLFCSIYLSYAAAFGFGTYLVLNVDLSPGSIIITFFSVLFGAFSLAQAGPSIADLNTARGAAAAIYKVIDEVPIINCLSNEGAKIQNFIGKLCFENVSFYYPSRPEVQVLKGLNLEVNVGQTVALVGSSGCGKSTTIQLIQRFYDPNEGTIRLDDMNLRDLNVKFLRENIGIVSQEPVLFATTIAENIRYGRLNVTQEDIHRAAKEANAYDFIQDLPDKFNTLVGERGAQLSGGQKQRIAIARALVRNPKILLLDEATSALDTESEGIVQAALEKVSAGRTTVVIAHRLSTIKNADMICAFKDGVIVERGTHAELMNIKDGVYQGLVQKQQTKEFASGELKDIEAVEIDNKELEELGASQSAAVMDSPSRKNTSERPMSAAAVIDPVKEKKLEEERKRKEDEEISKQYFSWGRIMKMNASETHYMILGTIGAAVNGGVQPAFAILFSRVLRAFGGPEEDLPSEMLLFCLLFVAIGVACLFAQFFQGFSFGKSGEELTLRLRREMFKAMLRQDISWFDDHANSTGALTTRLATEASLVQGVTGIRFGLLAEVFFNIVVAIIISFIYSWHLTLLVLGFVPLIGIAGLLEWTVYKSDTEVAKKKQEDSGKLVAEAVDNIRTVQSLTREMTFHKNYVASLKATYRKKMMQPIFGGMAFSFSQGVIYFAYAAVFRLGGHLVEICILEFDEVFLVLAAIIFGAFGLGRAFAYTPDYSKAKVATARMFKLMDKVPPIDVYSKKGTKPESYNATVSFQDVRFNYPTRPDVEVLQGLTVMVGPGETLALVGSSGCGKSTSVALTERFYDPLAGQVLLDSFDVKSLNLSWLRQQMGLVSQEPMLFDRTISENIAYGDNSRKVSQDEVEAAARKANIHDFVISLPEGYATRVGSKGTQLSGGQKQRIAIARALVRNPKILLLDEATSALDTESEKVVQEALDQAKKGRTCITIAHRLSTIHDAEKIAVIRQGKVAEFGTHDELMQLKEQYYSLYTSQSLAT